MTAGWGSGLFRQGLVRLVDLVSTVVVLSLAEREGGGMDLGVRGGNARSAFSEGMILLVKGVHACSLLEFRT